MNLNETIFHKNHIIGVEELDPPFREVRFQHLMKEFCENYNHYEADEFAVVWYEKDEDLYIQQIYNHDTGEVYWEDRSKELPNPNWTDNDEVLYCSLLMWGNLEQTIGMNI